MHAHTQTRGPALSGFVYKIYKSHDFYDLHALIYVIYDSISDLILLRFMDNFSSWWLTRPKSRHSVDSASVGVYTFAISVCLVGRSR